MARLPQLPPHHYAEGASPAELADQVAYTVEAATVSLSRWRQGEDKTQVIETLADAFRVWQMYERAFLAWAGPVDWVQAGYDAQAKQERILEDDDPGYVGTYPPAPGDQPSHEPTTAIPDMPPLHWADELSLGELALEVDAKVGLAVTSMAQYQPGEDRSEVLELHAYAFRAMQPWEDQVVTWAGPVDWVAVCQELTIRQEQELERDDPSYVSPVLHRDEAPSAPEAPPAPERPGPGRSGGRQGFDFGF